MSRLLTVATSVSHWWTGVYTAGLPEQERSARQAEIESDMWEHIAFDRRVGDGISATGLEVLMRMLLGIPADLFWRHSTRTAASSGVAASVPPTGDRTMLNRVLVASATALTVAAGLFLIVNAFGSARGDDWLFFAPAEVLTGVLMIAGVFLMNRSPRVAMTIVVLGAVGAVLAHYWILVVTLPIALAITIGSLARARSAPRREEKDPDEPDDHDSRHQRVPTPASHYSLLPPKNATLEDVDLEDPVPLSRSAVPVGRARVGREKVPPLRGNHRRFSARREE